MNQLFGISYSPFPIVDPENPDDGSPSGTDLYDENNWLYLEQEYFPEVLQYPDYNDVDNMHRRVLSGYSAQSYIKDDCPVDITEDGDIILVALTFYVLTPADDWVYQLETNIVPGFTYIDYEGIEQESLIKGRIVDEGITSIKKGYTTVFPMTDYIQFSHRITDMSYSWESVIIDSTGASTSSPTLEVDGRFLRSPKTVWGVLRMNYRAVAHQHTLVLGVKPQAGYEFTEINPQITAHWQYGGQTYSTSLELEIPQCVYDALSTCEDGVITIVLINPYKNKKIVYYNTCNGKFMRVCEAGKLKDAYHDAIK